MSKVLKMGAYVTETLHIPQTDENRNVRMFLNDDNEIFVCSGDENDLYSLWFTISKADWIVMKDFFDKHFE